MKNNISVVIPTHIRTEFIKKAINCVLLQSHKPNEIIIINDFKPGHFVKIINELKKKTKIPIKFYKSPFNSNAEESRNFASRKTKNDYIAFLDDDDIWKKNYLKNIFKIIKKNNSPDVIVSDFNEIDENNNLKRIVKFKNNFKIENYLVTNPGVLCSNIVIKTKVFKFLKGYDKSSGSADKELILRAYLNNFKIYRNKQIDVITLNHSLNWSKDNNKITIQKIKFFKKYFKFYTFRSFVKLTLYIITSYFRK